MKIFLILTAVTVLNLPMLQSQDMVSAKDKFTIKPIVKMTLNGKGAWMLLDTGSSVNLLNVSAREIYGFKTFPGYDTRRGVIGFASKELNLEHAGNIDLQYKGLKLKGHFLAYDISNIVASFKTETGKTISGIIGSEMMRRYGFVIDMGNRTTSIQYKKKKSRGVKSCTVRQKTANEIIY